MQSIIRAFLAVEISDAVRAELADVQEVLREANGHVGWVKPQNIHCTLVFLGDIFQEMVAPFAAALSHAAKSVNPFEIEIRGLGFFGSARSPQIIWAGITGAITPLLTLQNGLVAALLAAGLKTDEKPFNPHLTIGRARSNRNAHSLVTAMEKNQDKSFGVLSVRQVVLMESRLTANGPEYILLQSAALGG